MDLINLYLIPGVVLGCIYALGAVGLSLIYGVLRFGHFAHGDMMTFGAYATLSAVWATGLPPLVTLPVAIIVTAILAIVVDRLFYRPFRDHPTIVVVIASFGVALMLRSLVEIFWGADDQAYQTGIRRPILIFDALLVAPRHLAIVATAVVLVVVLHL